MKTRFTRLLVLTLTLCMLMTCLTGCQELDYREAVQLYNARQYDKAIDRFYELGDYEDSAALFTASHYWAAMERMEAGNYAEALPRFLKLGNYEDSAQRVTECRYQLGIQSFEAGNYSEAESYFRDTADYRLTTEYVRQLNWQKIYEYILSCGEDVDGSFVLTYPLPDRTVTFAADTSTALIQMNCVREKDMGYTFYDSLTLSLARATTVATFEAINEFTMAFGDGTIGSQQTGSGQVDLSSYIPGMLLNFDSFYMTVTDNFGQVTTTEDSINSTMDQTMADHLVAIMDCFSGLQVVSGTEGIF